MLCCGGLKKKEKYWRLIICNYKEEKFLKKISLRFFAQKKLCPQNCGITTENFEGRKFWRPKIMSQSFVFFTCLQSVAMIII